MADLQTLRRMLLGSVIGLARTCTTRPPTETTPGLILAGLHLSDDAVSATPEQLIALNERIQQNKFEVSPNCATCASPCGKNADYDLRRLDDAPEDVRQAKMRLIALLQVCGHRGKMADCVMDAVFALAEDWDAADFKVYEEQLIQFSSKPCHSHSIFFALALLRSACAYLQYASLHSALPERKICYARCHVLESN